MKYHLLYILLCLPNIVLAQGVTIKNTTDESYLLDRYEISSGQLLQNCNLTTKSIASSDLIFNIEQNETIIFSNRIDSFNKKNLLQKHQEFCMQEENIVYSKKPILKKLYTTPSNFFEYLDNKVFIAINPILYYQQMKEQGSAENLFINTRGFELKGNLMRKVSFYTQLTDNQERGPNFVRNWIATNEVVPGAGYIKQFKGNGVDYTLAKGYLDAEVLKNHINLSFGHDKFFIGDGYRSLLLSDFGNNQLFFKINTKFWRIHYQNIFTELYPTRKLGGDALLPRKYAAMHHLSINIKPNWSIGAFEGVVFGRKNHFDFQYLNPVIFYRTIEQQNGSPDNAFLGFDTKVLPIKNVEIYSQFVLDEFAFAKLKANKQWWGNKYAWQIGGKYINVASIKNLDLQVERNYIRPFTYSYNDSIADYSNYNQPLAHPNGANLIEHIAIVRYQPIAKLFLQAELINRQQGMDTSDTFSNGSNVLKNYNLRNGIDDGFTALGGTLVTTNYININASYQWKPNLYIDAGWMYRKANSDVAKFENTSSNIYFGLRLNSNRRLYNF